MMLGRMRVTPIARRVLSRRMSTATPDPRRHCSDTVKRGDYDGYLYSLLQGAQLRQGFRDTADARALSARPPVEKVVRLLSGHCTRVSSQNQGPPPSQPHVCLCSTTTAAAQCQSAINEPFLPAHFIHQIVRKHIPYHTGGTNKDEQVVYSNSLCRPTTIHGEHTIAVFVQEVQHRFSDGTP